MSVIDDATDQPVFPRVPVQVVATPLQVIVVLDGVFPESRLPNAPTPFFRFRGSDLCFDAPGGQVAKRELAFDFADAVAVVVIARRQLPDRVQVIRQQANREQIKGLSMPSVQDRLSKANLPERFTK